jgi:uncharacterized membrane protein
MRLLDVMIATLLIFPVLAPARSVQLPGGDSIEVADFGVPILVVFLVAAAVRASSRVDWRRAALAVGSLSARALLYAAGALAALLAVIWLWRLWESSNPGFGPASAIWGLTRGSGAVLPLVLYGAAVHRWRREPWERSFFVRLSIRAAHAWLRALGRSAPRALWSAAAIVGAVLLGVALLRHWAFQSHGHDLGLFTNTIWNLTHGNGYVSSIKGGINLFIDHQSPIFWALAPLFRLAPFPETLLFAQAFGLAAGGPALFYLGRAHFGREHWVSAALPWLYWSWLPLRNANSFDFHPEVFMLPLFLWAFVALAYQRRWAKVAGVLARVAALGAKESAPVVATGIGLAWAFSGRRAWPGLALAAAGVAVFFFDVKVVPQLFGDQYPYMNLYGRFGGGIIDLILAPFTQPAYFFSQVLNRERLNFLFWTLAPLGFLPLFDWRAALAVLPTYLMLFLAEGDQRVRIVFHYGIEPGSALFWGLPLGLAVFARRFGWKRAGIWMLVWCVGAHGPGELARAQGYFHVPHRAWLAEAVPCLHPDLPMAASGALAAHLATRAWISYPDQLRQQPSGEPVRCVVTDLYVVNWPVGRAGIERVLAELPAHGYREVFHCNDFRVFELGDSGCLRCRPRCY